MQDHQGFAVDAYLRRWTELAGLFADGRFEGALGVLEGMRRDFPDRITAVTHAWACLLCLTDRPGDALALMREVVQTGSWWSPRRLDDPDLGRVADDIAFTQLADVMRQRADAAVAAARRAEADVLVLRGTGPIRAAVVALHMYGVPAGETAAVWKPTVADGLVVAVPESTLRDGDGWPCWDDEALAERDVRRAVQAAREAAGAAPLLLAGGSQGAALAIRFALDGRVPGCRGFIGVVGAPDLALVADAFPSAAGRGVRGFLVAGEADPQTRHRQELLRDRLSAAGIDCALSVIEGMPHVYPAPWAQTAREALKFCLEG